MISIARQSMEARHGGGPLTQSSDPVRFPGNHAITVSKYFPNQSPRVLLGLTDDKGDE